MPQMAGAAKGAADTLEQLLAEQFAREQFEEEQQQARERERQSREELSRRAQEDIEQSRQFDALLTARGDESAAERRQRSNTEGLKLMGQDRAAMDTETAITSLPPHLQAIGPLMRVGAVRDMSPGDLEDPQTRAAREQATHDRDINDRIRVAREGRAPQAPGKQVWVWRGDGKTPIPIEEGTAQPGDRPYNEATNRADTASAGRQESVVEIAQSALDTIETLRTTPGFAGAVGAPSVMQPGSWSRAVGLPPAPGSASASYAPYISALKSQLTIPRMQMIRGLGQMSDREFRTMSDSVSALNENMSETQFLQELRSIETALHKVTQAPARPSPSQMPGGPVPVGDPLGIRRPK